MYKKNIWQKNVQNINWKQKKLWRKIVRKKIKIELREKNWERRNILETRFWKKKIWTKFQKQIAWSKLLNEKKTGEQKFYTKIGELITADN